MNFTRPKHQPQIEGSIECASVQESQSIDKNETNTIKNMIQVCY